MVVDQSTGKAYVSSPITETDSIAVFNSETLVQEDSLPTPGFGNAMGLQMNQENGDLYSVSLRAPKAVKVNVRTGQSTIYELDEDMVSRESSVAVDSDTETLFCQPAHQQCNRLQPEEFDGQGKHRHRRTGTVRHLRSLLEKDLRGKPYGWDPDCH